VYNNCAAQIQQAWVAHYNNGITNGTNQAVKMALDPTGNIYVTGFSQNTNSSLGYVTIKYAPNGTQLWAARYDSTSYSSASPAAMVLDASNNVIVTGSALTKKYDPNGNQVWTAPYAGTALAVDSNANIYVVGFSQNFGTVKLSPQGSNVWLTTYVEPYGPTISQSVLVDSGNNLYVSGLDSYTAYVNNGIHYGPYVTLTTIKYGSNGNQLWKASQYPSPENYTLQVQNAVMDRSGSVYLEAFFSPFGDFNVYKYSDSGSLLWTANDPDENVGPNVADDMLLDSVGNVMLTGQFVYLGPENAYAVYAYGTYKANTNGSWIWTNLYPIGQFPPSSAQAIAVDSANNSYVTGYSPGTNSLNDIVTIKYGPNGNQLWLQRYNGPGNGNDAGNAIAVDSYGNVYVAGYDTTTDGGTEMVLIKYSPAVGLQKRADGSVLLEAQVLPGDTFDIQASPDLINWLDLGNVTADTNGLMQFDDTNAINYGARFYITNPQ
jgi:hypothetical protein